MLSLRNKIGQMLVMGFEGCSITDDSPVAQWLSGDGLGGVLLFDQDWSTGQYGKNLKNPSQIKQLTQKLKDYAAQSALEELDLLVALDYEGGAVDRLAKIEGCRATLRAEQLTFASKAELETEWSLMALGLKELGFNLNFAPVVDLALNKQEGIIGKLGRSFSQDPDKVVSLAAQFVEVFARHGIACSYKHFPGHGSALGDTHQACVDVTSTFQFAELIPYYQLLQKKNQPIMVMTAHVVNKHLDAAGWPATLSYAMLTGILRRTMAYEGVIISDDLQMQAISHHYGLGEALALTINAGADMMIFGNQLGSITAPEVISCIEQLVQDKKVGVERIEEAYRRIVRLKQSISLHNPCLQQ